MAAQEGQDQKDQVRSKLEEKVPEKQGFFQRVKDSLNFTKHLGFVSDLDSPAAQAALAAHREKETKEGVQEEVPQAPLHERIKDGITDIAKTAAEVVGGTSGAVVPKSNESTNEPTDVKEGVASTVNATVGAAAAGTAGEAPADSVIPEGEEQPEVDQKDLPVVEKLSIQEEGDNPTAPVPKKSEGHKYSFLPHCGNKDKSKETDPNAEGEHKFWKGAMHVARKLGDVVASKDLTDESSKKDTTKWTEGDTVSQF